MRKLYWFFFLLLLNLIPLFCDEKAPENGKSLYDAGRYEDAASWYLGRSSQRNQRALDYYNAARCFQQDYLQNHNSESLDKAVTGYYRVLELNPDMKEARINLELARREQEKNQKQNQSGNSGQENQPKDDQSRNDQSGQDGKQQDSIQGRNENSSDLLSDMAEKQKELSQSESSAENKKEQESLNQQTKEALERSENQSQKEALQKALEKQNEALAKMDENKNEEARDAQKSAADFLNQAAESSYQEDQNESLPQDLQKLLNQEQSRRKEEQNPDNLMHVERNW